MAHYVGKVLHIRPSDILDTWGGAELIVAYGQYMNEVAIENYHTYESIYLKKNAGTPPPPKKYAVRFIGVRKMESIDG